MLLEAKERVRERPVDLVRGRAEELLHVAGEEQVEGAAAEPADDPALQVGFSLWATETCDAKACDTARDFPDAECPNRLAGIVGIAKRPAVEEDTRPSGNSVVVSADELRP